ncbi:MAG: ribonuclease-3 [Gammaproteobacteria bacterium]
MPLADIRERARHVVAKIGHDFKDEALLVRALTHRSASSGNNERLEFLGDAVIELVVTAWLFELFPQCSEGELTRLRAKIVRRESLAGYARGLALGDALHLGSGEMKSGGRYRDSILADGFEALIGAMFLDAGFHVCRERLISLIEPGLPELVEAATTKDAKTRLQEWLQGRGLPLPRYDVVRTEGDDHQRTFTVQCEVDGMSESIVGGGSSRRRAEQDAAARALDALGLSSARG